MAKARKVTIPIGRGIQRYIRYVNELGGTSLRYTPGTGKPYRGKIYTHGWVLGLVTIEGLKRTGRNLEREAFIDTMERIKDFDTLGLCGPISYSSTSHKGGSTWKIFKADPDTGRFRPLTGWRKSD